MPDSLLLAFPPFAEASRRLAERIGCAHDTLEVHRFPDGESLVRLPPALPAHVLFYVSFHQANRQLIELELAAATALGLGANRLTLVAPYLCYMRQDRAFHPGEAISQRIIGQMLARRFDTVLTVDPHLHRVHRLHAAIPVRNAIAVSAAPLMSRWLTERGGNPLLVGPDEESAQWLQAIGTAANLEYVVARKQRKGDRDVTVQLPDYEFSGRDIVLVDDVASTGRTLAEVARQLRARGTRSITALVTHALFVGDAEPNLKAAGVEKICSTDSLPHSSNCLALDPVLAAALQQDRR